MPESPTPKPTLEEIENDLHVHASIDKNNWVDIAQDIMTVEREKLFESKYRSFTAWVKAISTKIGLSESVLWTRYKAGRVYVEFALRQQAQGIEVPSFSSVKASPELLKAAETIAGTDPKRFDNIIKGILDGRIRRDTMRHLLAKRIIDKAPQRNRHSATADANLRNAIANNPDTALIAGNSEAKPSIIASDIVHALSNPNNWLTIKSDRGPLFPHVFDTITEFRAESGSSDRTRRIDLVAVENWTADYDTILGRDDVFIHGFEIKVTEYDLLRDNKCAEYSQFVDYFSLAVADDAALVSSALNVALDDWGVYVIDANGGVRCLREPAYRPGAQRERSLHNVIKRLMLHATVKTKHDQGEAPTSTNETEKAEG